MIRYSLLVGAFVILTNPLFAAPKSSYTFNRSSIIQIDFDPKDCRWADETGVGCKKAYLTFGGMVAKSEPLPDEETVVFHDPKTGQWSMSLRYHPKECEMVKTVSGAVRGLCRRVSWRLAK